MSFRVLVHMSVVNEDGEEVSAKGHPLIVFQPTPPLESKQDLEFEKFETATKVMNAIFKTVQAIGEVA